MAAAVVIVGSEKARNKGDSSPSLPFVKAQVRQGSLACVEVLGRSVLGRTIEELVRAGCESVSVFAPNEFFTSAVIGHEKVEFQSVSDIWGCAARKIEALKDAGTDLVLLICLGAYIEFDAGMLLQFHHDSGDSVTRARDDHGSLDLWAVNSHDIAGIENLDSFLQAVKPAKYRVPGYVNRLQGPRDLRRLICDGLTSRCQFRPQAFEVRPGVWVAPGSQVQRGARIVAPAFIGRGAKIGEQCLITRGSNIESNAHVDYGTVVEDSSVLSNTYVGIGLDLSHCIADGNHLLNLQHEVVLRIDDPVVLRHLRETKTATNNNRRMLANLDFEELAMSSTANDSQ